MPASHSLDAENQAHVASTGHPTLAATLVLTAVAMTAFAANSILCRFALGAGAIDAASYTSTRMLSGAGALIAIAAAAGKQRSLSLSGSWASGALLYLYAITFSFAYVSLSVGAGALLLFGAVQATMIISALWRGDRPSPVEWVGLGIAAAGLVYLVSPGVQAPTPHGAVLMIVAGISWGLYSLRGKAESDPLAATTSNFLRTAPLAVGTALLAFAQAHATSKGLILAAISGAFASGCGYVVWYAALKGLSATRAAVVQLSVPAITAVAGVLLLAEPLSVRVSVSTIMVLGGIALSFLWRGRSRSASKT